MKTRLVINGFEVDLREDVDINITFSIDDIKLPNSKRRTSSKGIVLAGTQRNREFFLSTYDVKLSTENIPAQFNPTERVEAQVYQGDTIIFDGLFQIRIVRLIGEDIEIEGVLYSNFLGLFERIGDLFISQLGWDEYDHTLDGTSIPRSWGTTGTNQVYRNGAYTGNFAKPFGGQDYPSGFGYMYGVIDWGLAYNRATPTSHFITSIGQPYPNWQHNELVPLLYCLEIITKILDFAGVTWNDSISDIFTRPDYTNTAANIPYSNPILYMLLGWEGGDMPKVDSTERTARRVTVTGGTGLGSSLNYQKNFATGNGQVLVLPKADEVIMLDDAYWTVSSKTDALVQFSNATGKVITSKFGMYRLHLTGTFQLEADVYAVGSGTITNFEIQQAIGVDIHIRAGNTDVKIADAVFGYFAPDLTNQTLTFSIDYKIDVPLNQGEEVYVYFRPKGAIRVTAGYTPSGYGLVYKLRNASTYAISFDMQSIDQSYITGETVKLATFIPKIKCSDFLRSIFRMFNIQSNDIDDDGYVEFYPRENNAIWIDTWGEAFYLNTIDNQIDWTQKLDKSQPIEIESASLIQGKRYTYKYSTETDFYNQYYKDSTKKEFGQRIHTVPTTFQVGDILTELPFAITPPVYKGSSHTSSNQFICSRVITYDPVNGYSKPYTGAARLFCLAGPQTVNGNIRLYNTSFASPVLYSGIPLLANFGGYSTSRGLYTYYFFDLCYQTPDEIYYTIPSRYPNANLWDFQKSMINEITSKDSKIVRCYVNLTSEDIRKLDFRKLINIDGTLYRLNLITEYRVGTYESTQVELIKYIAPLVVQDIPEQNDGPDSTNDLPNDIN